MDGQMDLFALGKLESKDSLRLSDSDQRKVRCFKSELKAVKYLTPKELFSGFNTIKAITFSFDISFLAEIMDNFDYGKIIFGANFLVEKNKNLNDFLANTYTYAKEARDAIQSYPKISEMFLNGDLCIRTPTFNIYHKKIYLLKADDGRTKVIRTSANMTKRAWGLDDSEFYDYDDTENGYKQWEKVFESAWKQSEDIPISVVSAKINSNKDDLIEGNPILKGVKETNRTIVLKQTEKDTSIDFVKYVINHEKLQEEYKAIINGLNPKVKEGRYEIKPAIIKKMELNSKKLKRKKAEIIPKEEDYPSLNINYEQCEVMLNGINLDLHPTEEEVRSDISELLGIFDNFNNFIGDVRKLKENHFKLLNMMFESVFHAKIRCEAAILGIDTSCLPLHLLCTSSMASCGKSFMISSILKLMTGKTINSLDKSDCKSETIRAIQTGVKNIPVFIDEVDNAYIGRISGIIKTPQRCEEYQREDQPMLIFASNSCNDPDAALRKRMVFIRLNGTLPSNIDRSAYNSRSLAIEKRLGTGLYREYLRRMIQQINNLFDYMDQEKESDLWYPDIISTSSKTIIDIISDYGFEIPNYMKILSWSENYAENAKYIADESIEKIKYLYRHNKKAFMIEKNTVTIELGNSKDSSKLHATLLNTLPSETNAKDISNAKSLRIIMKRDELEKLTGFKFGFHPFSKTN